MSKIGSEITGGLRDALQYEGETTRSKEHRVLIPERVDKNRRRVGLGDGKRAMLCRNVKLQ